jgi:hypothetical protein
MKELEIKAYKYNRNSFNKEFKNAIYDYIHTFEFDISSCSQKGNFFNLPCSFDIENSSFIDNGQKRVLVYIWQFGIYNHVWYGRELTEFIDVLSDLQNLLDDIRKKEFSKTKKLNKIFHLCIYVHNLNYEYSYIHRYIKIKEHSIVALSKTNLIKFDIEPIYKHILIEFRCSHKLTMLSLRDCAEKTFKRKIRKQPAIDYKLIRTPETELTDDEIQYAIYDIYVTNNIIHEKYESGEFQCDIPLTVTGYPRKYLYDLIKLRDSDEYKQISKHTMIHNMYKYNLYKCCYHGGFTHSSIMHCFAFRKNVTHLDITSSYPTVLLSEKYPRQEFKSVYQKTGGVINDKFTSDFISDCTLPEEECRDINYWIKTPISELRKQGYGYIIEVFFYKIEYNSDNIDDCYIAENMILNYKNEIQNCPECTISRVFNGRIVSAENVLLRMTDIDYKLVFQTYKISGQVVLEIFYSLFDYLPYEMCKTILFFYGEKTKYKGQDEKLYMAYKQRLNSIYGMCVTDKIRDDYLYDSDTNELISEFDKIQSEFELNQKIQTKINNADRSNKLFYMWGVYCSSYARKNLIFGIMECGHDYLYSDTDSIFTLNYDKHKSYFETYNIQIQEKIKNNTTIKNNPDLQELLNATDMNSVYYPLGVWELDDSIKIDGQKKKCDIEFCSIGAKRYMQIFTDKETGKYLDFKITFAGVDPKILKRALWENYNKDIETIKNVFINMGIDPTYEIEIKPEQNTKFATCIINELCEGDISDYKGNKYHYKNFGGTYLFKVGYKISQLSEDMKFAFYVMYQTLQAGKKLL